VEEEEFADDDGGDIESAPVIAAQRVPVCVVTSRLDVSPPPGLGASKAGPEDAIPPVDPENAEPAGADEEKKQKNAPLPIGWLERIRFGLLWGLNLAQQDFEKCDCSSSSYSFMPFRAPERGKKWRGNDGEGFFKKLTEHSLSTPPPPLLKLGICCTSC